MSSVTSLNDTELTTHDLRELTNQMVDRMLKLIEGCSDSDVTQEPEDRRHTTRQPPPRSS